MAERSAKPFSKAQASLEAVSELFKGLNVPFASLLDFRNEPDDVGVKTLYDLQASTFLTMQAGYWSAIASKQHTIGHSALGTAVRNEVTARFVFIIRCSQ